MVFFRCVIVNTLYKGVGDGGGGGGGSGDGGGDNLVVPFVSCKMWQSSANM